MVARPLDRSELVKASDLVGHARVLGVASSKRIRGEAATLRFVDVQKGRWRLAASWPFQSVSVGLRPPSDGTLGDWTDRGAYRPGSIVRTHLAWDATSKLYRTVWWNGVWIEDPPPRTSPLAAAGRRLLQLGLGTRHRPISDRPAAPALDPAEAALLHGKADVVMEADVLTVGRETPWHPMMAEARCRTLLKARDGQDRALTGRVVMIRIGQQSLFASGQRFVPGTRGILYLRKGEPYGSFYDAV